MPLSIPVIADAFEDVNSLIVKQLRSDVGLVEDIGQYIVAAGGKRMRPTLVLLTAAALGKISLDGLISCKLWVLVERVYIDIWIESRFLLGIKPIIGIYYRISGCAYLHGFDIWVQVDWTGWGYCPTITILIIIGPIIGRGIRYRRTIANATASNAHQ